MISLSMPDQQVILQPLFFTGRVWQRVTGTYPYRGRSRAFILTRPVLALFVLVVSLAAPFRAVSQPAGLNLPMPSQTAALPAPFDAEKSFPSVSNGFLVSFTRELTSPGNVDLRDLSTLKGRTPPFWLSAASKISLYDAAVTSDKRSLVLAGTYTPSAGGSDVHFIAIQDLSTGKASLIKPAGDYVPLRVCAASDGTIWTLGQTQAEAQHIEVSPLPDYEMVRSYSLDGTMQGSFVPRSSQGTAPLNLQPFGRAFGSRLETQQLNAARLSCGDRSVGVFIGRPVNSWTEINLSGKTVQRWTIQPVPGATITGLALLGGNTVYASFSARGANRSVLSLHRLSLSGDRGEWVQVADRGPADKTFAVLLGRDGSALVHLRGVRTPNNTTLYWSTP